MAKNTHFQYCQKLVILSEDKKSVLLAKRKGEADYDDTYSFIGGKLETTDASILAGIKREKDEEIGPMAKVKILPHETHNLLFKKKDGNSVILPHIPGLYITGAIQLNNEYSNYKWVTIDALETFETKIENIPQLTHWALQKLSAANLDFVEI